ncbi:hypothetical protein PPERSA_12029 [Pseudocohnilembus persalinus]|uniref:RanBP2-type domain-containing protein n=1 Tax=Pseudocohnilembus persalinus TaxID=266149 RepID=A0A0V0R8U7_PSEPJ|nr:hypothetical protein PPERSA_12029 [Pseudocohnilembus persalinus]|eukprot:KRX10905.1 hypothetical protein PPERSA_12029 [Pseudocohnilembus persalinus]
MSENQEGNENLQWKCPGCYQINEIDSSNCTKCDQEIPRDYQQFQKIGQEQNKKENEKEEEEIQNQQKLIKDKLQHLNQGGSQDDQLGKNISEQFKDSLQLNHDGDSEEQKQNSNEQQQKNLENQNLDKKVSQNESSENQQNNNSQSSADEEEKNEKEEVQVENDNNIEKNLEEALKKKDEGAQYFKQGHWKQAIEEYEDAIDFCPEEEKKTLSVLYSNLGICNIKLELWEEAISHCSKSISLDTEYRKPYLNRAIAYEKSEREEEALEVGSICMFLIGTIMLAIREYDYQIYDGNFENWIKFMGVMQIHQENCEDILCPCREGAKNSKGWKELTKHNSTGKAIIRDGIYLPSLWKNKQKLQLWLEDFIEYQFLKLLGHIQNMRVNSLYYLYAFFYFWSFEIEGIKNYVKCIYLIKEQVTAYRRNIDENKINFYLLIVETYFSQYIENIICQHDKSLEYSNKITDINNAILIRMFGSLVINEFALEDLKQQLIQVLSKKQDIYYKLTNGYISYTEFQQDLIYLVKASRKIEKQIYKNLQKGGENIHYYKILQLIKLIIFNDLVSVQAVDRKLQDLILKDSKEDELLVHSISILKGNVTSLLMNYKEYTCSVIGYSSNSPGFFGYEKNEFQQLKNINFTLPECLAYYHDSMVGRLIREGNSHILRKYRVLVSRTKDNFIFPCKIYVDYFFHITNQLCFSGTILKIQNSYQYMIVSQDGWIQDISEGLIDTLKQYANIEDIDTEILKQANIKALFPQLLEFLENYEANQIQPNTNHIFTMSCQHLYESYCTVIDVHIRITKEHLEVDHKGLKQDLKMFILEMNQFTIVDQFYSKDQENLYFEKELNALQSDMGMADEFNQNQDKQELPQNLNINDNNGFNFLDYPKNNNNNNNYQYKIDENQKILSLEDANESYNIQLSDELKYKINELTYDEKRALSQILDKLTANNLIFQESLNNKNESLIKQQLKIDQIDNSLGIEKEVEKFTDIIDQIKKQNLGFDQVQKYMQQKQDKYLLKANTPLSPFQRKQTAELTDNKNKQNLNKQVSKMSQSINNSQSVLQKLLTMGTAFTQKSQKNKKKSIYEVKTKIKTLMVLTKMVGKKALGGIGEMVKGQDKQNNKQSLMKTLAHNNGDKYNKNKLQIPETLAIRRDKKFNFDDEKNEDSKMIISDLEAIQMVEEQNFSSEDEMPGDFELNKQDVDQQVFLEEDEEEKEDWEKFINSNNYLDLVKQVLQQLGEYEQSYYDKGFQKQKSKRDKPGMSVYDQSIFEAQKMGDSDTTSQESIGSSDIDMRDIQQVDAMNNVKFDQDVFSFNTYYSSQMSRNNIGQNNLILENYGIYDYVDESLLNAQNKFLLNQNEQAYQNFKNQLYSQLSTPIYYPVQEYFFDETDTFRNWNSTFQTYNKITDRYLSENMKIIQQGFIFSSDYISGFGSQLENEQEFVQAIIDYSYLIQCTDNINFKHLIQNEQTVFSDDIYTEFLDIQEQTLEDVSNYFTYQYRNLQNSKQSSDFKEKVIEINQGNNCEREFLNELEQQSCKNSAKKIADQGFQVTLTHILNGITGEIQSELTDYNDYKTYIEVSDQQEEIQVQLIMMKTMQTIYDYFNDDNNSLLSQKKMIIWLLYIGFITVYIVLLIFVCFEFLNLFVFKFPYLKYALLTMPLQRLREGNNTLTLIKNIFAST